MAPPTFHKNEAHLQPQDFVEFSLSENYVAIRCGIWNTIYQYHVTIFSCFAELQTPQIHKYIKICWFPGAPQGGEYPTSPSILMMLRLETSDLRRWDRMAKDGFMLPRTPWLTMNQGSWKWDLYFFGGINFDANLWQFGGMSLFWCMSPMTSISCLTKLLLDGKKWFKNHCWAGVLRSDGGLR